MLTSSSSCFHRFYPSFYISFHMCFKRQFLCRCNSISRRSC